MREKFGDISPPYWTSKPLCRVPATMPTMVSLCATVFNEIESIEPWLRSLREQTRQPDEVVICDGGSTDGTAEVLVSFAERDSSFRVIIRPGANVPEGRNLAIDAANGSLIAVTDAGTILDRGWLEGIIRPLEEDQEVAVSAGCFVPAGRNRFEYILATTMTPPLDKFPVDGFPPSSRSVAFRKQWWETVGGYPEWLRAGEDLLFDFRLRDAGARFCLAPEAIVSWYPRPTLRTFFDQYRHYARGDGHGQIRTRTHLMRISGWILGLALLRLSQRFKFALVLLGLGLTFHMRREFARVLRKGAIDGAKNKAIAVALVPIIAIIGDLARMSGYPQGVWERLRAGGPDGLREARIGSHRDHDLVVSSQDAIDSQWT